MNTKSVEEYQRTPQRSQKHARRRLRRRRSLSASRLNDFSPKNRRYLYPANRIFRTVIELVHIYQTKTSIFVGKKIF